MAKSIEVSNKSDKPLIDTRVKEPEVVLPRVLKYNKSSNTVPVRCLLDARTSVTGAVTGEVYIFSGAGAIVDVAQEDADELLNKKRGRACCGGKSGKFVFQLA